MTEKSQNFHWQNKDCLITRETIQCDKECVQIIRDVQHNKQKAKFSFSKKSLSYNKVKFCI